jgi:hypothetical protein
MEDEVFRIKVQLTKVGGLKTLFNAKTSRGLSFGQKRYRQI